MKRIVTLASLVLTIAIAAQSQTATVKRNVNLRPDPTTENAPITTLMPPAQLELVEPNSTDGYFHVRTADNKEGWVWGKNIQMVSNVSQPASSAHIGPPQLYPNPVLTKGLADTLKATDLTKRYTVGCPSGMTSCTYSQSHRDVPESVKTQVYVEYSVPVNERNLKHGEVDHFYPLCAGGSNDIKNLWDQPAENEWNGENFGFHEKDKLETFVCSQIIAKKVNPKDAFNRFTTDWVKYYLDLGLNAMD